MPTTPRTFCEQCLRDTTRRGECERHPYSRQLSMSQPGDREHYLVMRRLRWGRRVPWMFLTGYLVLTAGIGVAHFFSEARPSLIGSFIFSNFAFIALLLLSSPLVVALWFFGLLSRDLMLGIRRRIWGIQVEDIPEMLTAPVADPNPLLSAEEARSLRQAHREARAKAGSARFIR